MAIQLTLDSKTIGTNGSIYWNFSDGIQLEQNFADGPIEIEIEKQMIIGLLRNVLMSQFDIETFENPMTLVWDIDNPSGNILRVAQ